MTCMLLMYVYSLVHFHHLLPLHTCPACFRNIPGWSFSAAVSTTQQTLVLVGDLAGVVVSVCFQSNYDGMVDAL